MAHCGAHHRQSRIIFHGCKGSVQWYCGRETVTGTSNNGCTFCLRSSCYTGLTGLLEEQPVCEMKNGRGRCSCRIKQIYVTSSFVRLVLHQLAFINLSIGESFFFFFWIYSNISFQSFLFFFDRYNIVQIFGNWLKNQYSFRNSERQILITVLEFKLSVREPYEKSITIFLFLYHWRIKREYFNPT